MIRVHFEQSTCRLQVVRRMTPHPKRGLLGGPFQAVFWLEWDSDTSLTLCHPESYGSTSVGRAILLWFCLRINNQTYGLTEQQGQQHSPTGIFAVINWRG